jgi:hypothetical protein
MKSGLSKNDEKYWAGGRQFGKSFENYIRFIAMVKTGKRPIVIGKDLVVISTKMYHELTAKNQL